MQQTGSLDVTRATLPRRTLDVRPNRARTAGSPRIHAAAASVETHRRHADKDDHHASAPNAISARCPTVAPLDTGVAWVRDLLALIDVDSREGRAVAVWKAATDQGTSLSHEGTNIAAEPQPTSRPPRNTMPGSCASGSAHTTRTRPRRLWVSSSSGWKRRAAVLRPIRLPASCLRLRGSCSGWSASCRTGR